jgi:hypothetical protein
MRNTALLSICELDEYTRKLWDGLAIMEGPILIVAGILYQE